MLMASPVPRPITAITFDLGNVLIRVDHLRFCRRLAALAALTPQEVYAQVFESSLEPGYDTGRITSREFYQRVTDHFGVALPYSRFCDLWCDLFDPMEGMAELVAHLASSFPLFLLSNTNALHFDYIKERFRLISCSHSGPSSCPMRWAAANRSRPSTSPSSGRRGARPEEILFLDDKVSFVEAARGQGLTAWQFRSPQELQPELARQGLW